MVGVRSATGVHGRAIAWGALAIAAGACAALLPLEVAIALFATVGLAVALLIEPVLGLIVMVCVAPLKVLIETEAPIALPGDIGQWSLALALGVWAVWRASQVPTRPLPRSRVAVALAVIMLGFTPSLFTATSTGAWIAEVAKWAVMLVLTLLVIDLGARGRWAWLAFGVVLAAAIQAVIGLYEFFGGSGAPHLWIAAYTRFRAFGTFGQPNPFSAFMGLTLPLALGLGWGYAREAWAFWRLSDRHAAARAGAVVAVYGTCAALIAGGLIASWGRGAWLGFAAALSVMAVFAPRRRLIGVGLLVIALALGVVLWVGGLVPASIEARVTNTLDEFVGFDDVRGVFVTNENFSTVERMAHWQAALSMASARPLTGVGLGNYEMVYADHALARWPHALGHAHNDYLNILAETGIIGLASALVGWALIVGWTARALRVHSPVWNGLALGLLGTWTHLAVHSLFDKLTVNNLFLHIGVMLGLLALVDARRRAAEDSDYVFIQSH
ncbi:MAG: O-antigen ligase family protein [Chloroflexi bacterium]|nr:O-antigen ligase family protein [Chloroflexota bacterium]